MRNGTPLMDSPFGVPTTKTSGGTPAGTITTTSVDVATFRAHDFVARITPLILTARNLTGFRAESREARECGGHSLQEPFLPHISRGVDPAPPLLGHRESHLEAAGIGGPAIGAHAQLVFGARINIERPASLDRVGNEPR